MKSADSLKPDAVNRDLYCQYDFLNDITVLAADDHALSMNYLTGCNLLQ